MKTYEKRINNDHCHSDRGSPGRHGLLEVQPREPTGTNK